jgi:hypothetical protein
MNRKKVYLSVLIIAIIRVIYSVLTQFGMRFIVQIISHDQIVPVMQVIQIFHWILTFAIIIGLIVSFIKWRQIMTMISLILIAIQIGLRFGMVFFIQNIVNNEIPRILSSLTTGQIIAYASYISIGFSVVIDISIIIIISVLYSRQVHVLEAKE